MPGPPTDLPLTGVDTALTCHPASVESAVSLVALPDFVLASKEEHYVRRWTG